MKKAQLNKYYLLLLVIVFWTLLISFGNIFKVALVETDSDAFKSPTNLTYQEPDALKFTMDMVTFKYASTYPLVTTFLSALVVLTVFTAYMLIRGD